MYESQDQCFEQNQQAFEIVRVIAQNSIPNYSELSRKLIFKDPYCIYPKNNLFKYPQYLDQIPSQSQFYSQPDISQLMPLSLIQDNEDNKIHSFIRKMNCIFNRFKDNAELKYDATIFLKNIRSITGTDMLNKYQKQFELQIENISIKNRKLFIFQSNYQSGNLNYVFRSKNQKLGSPKYYLLLQNDINTHGYNQWFSFYIKPVWSSIVRKTITIRICIINNTKAIKFMKGMKIFTCTAGRWQIVQPFIYYENKLEKCFGGKNMCIDFEYTFNFQNNNFGTFFTLNYPYTYSKLLNLLKQIKNNPTQGYYMPKIQEIGQTDGRNSIFMVHLCKNNQQKKLDKTKPKAIIIVARQHPVQTPASFICQHIIKYILSLNQSQHCLYEWFIFPMANPDGVVHGNTRTNLKGYDINRCWSTQGLGVCSQSSCIDKRIRQIFKKYDCQYFIDLHGHSKQTGFFCFYAEKNRCNLIFNGLLKQKCPYYRTQCSLFGIRSSKKNTLRGQLFHRYHFPRVITVQVSIFGYEQKNILKYYDDQDYRKISIALIQALHEYKRVRQADYQRYKKISKQILIKNKKNKKQDSGDSDSNPEGQYLLEKQRQLLQLNQLNKVSMQKLIIQNQAIKYNKFGSVLLSDSDDNDSEKQFPLKSTITVIQKKKSSENRRPIYTSLYNPDKNLSKKLPRRRYSFISLHKTEQKFSKKHYKDKNSSYHTINGMQFKAKSLIEYPTRSDIRLQMNSEKTMNLLSDCYKRINTEIKLKQSKRAKQKQLDRIPNKRIKKRIYSLRNNIINSSKLKNQSNCDIIQGSSNKKIQP